MAVKIKHNELCVRLFQNVMPGTIVRPCDRSVMLMVLDMHLVKITRPDGTPYDFDSVFVCRIESNGSMGLVQAVKGTDKCIELDVEIVVPV